MIEPTFRVGKVASALRDEGRRTCDTTSGDRMTPSSCMRLPGWLACASFALIPILGHALCWLGFDGGLALGLACTPLALVVLVGAGLVLARRLRGKASPGHS